MSKNSVENKRVLISLLEPTIEWIMRCIFKGAHQRQADYILGELGLGTNISKFSGDFSCISIVLHHLLKELPAEVVCSHALVFVQLIEYNNDFSSELYMSYRLLGFKLCERRPQVDNVDALLAKIFQDNYLTIILDGISVRACNQVVAENDLNSLQSVLIKLLAHFNDLEDVFALNHFVEILDVMYGRERKGCS